MCKSYLLWVLAFASLVGLLIGNIIIDHKIEKKVMEMKTDKECICKCENKKDYTHADTWKKISLECFKLYSKCKDEIPPGR